ncbi:unnamed protein product [Closterium sp. Naga37s-1]|nr:unnamed protein product [Closterium sp. Naga37s-1]
MSWDPCLCTLKDGEPGVVVDVLVIAKVRAKQAVTRGDYAACHDLGPPLPLSPLPPSPRPPLALPSPSPRPPLALPSPSPRPPFAPPPPPSPFPVSPCATDPALL